jgi:hypothetical protein
MRLSIASVIGGAEALGEVREVIADEQFRLAR